MYGLQVMYNACMIKGRHESCGMDRCITRHHLLWWRLHNSNHCKFHSNLLVWCIVCFTLYHNISYYVLYNCINLYYIILCYAICYIILYCIKLFYEGY